MRTPDDLAIRSSAGALERPRARPGVVAEEASEGYGEELTDEELESVVGGLGRLPGEDRPAPLPGPSFLRIDDSDEP